MIAAVYVVRMSIPDDASLATRFGVQVLAGGIGYLLTLVTLHRHRIRMFVNLVKGGTVSPFKA
jgi:hypothetical protein